MRNWILGEQFLYWVSVRKKKYPWNLTLPNTQGKRGVTPVDPVLVRALLQVRLGRFAKLIDLVPFSILSLDRLLVGFPQTTPIT